MSVARTLGSMAVLGVFAVLGAGTSDSGKTTSPTSSSESSRSAAAPSSDSKSTKTPAEEISAAREALDHFSSVDKFETTDHVLVALEGLQVIYLASRHGLSSDDPQTKKSA